MEKKTPQIEFSGKITFEGFFYLVRQMRYNQRRYSRLGNPAVLEKAREIEKQVDEIISSVVNKQLDLF